MNLQTDEPSNPNPDQDGVALTAQQVTDVEPILTEGDDQTNDPRTMAGSRSTGRWVGLLLLGLLSAGTGLFYFRPVIADWLVTQGLIGADDEYSQLDERLGVVEKALVNLQAQQQIFVTEATDQLRLTTQSSQQLAELAKQVSAQTEHANQRLAEVESELKAELARQRIDWLPIQVRHLLFLAEQLLYVAGDPSGATQALQRADLLLKTANEPRWLPLRKEITVALSALASSATVDVEGTRLRLHQVASQIDQLSGFVELTQAQSTGLVTPINPTQDNSTGLGWGAWRQRFDRAWTQVVAQFSDLVRIQHTGERVAPALSSTQLQGLKLRLTGELLLAEIELIRGDANYNQRLQTVIQVISQYFDGKSQPGAVILRELEQLQALEVSSELADISAPLAWLDQRLAGVAER